MSALEQGKNILIQCDGHSLKTVTDHILRTGERESGGAHFDSEATTREGERGGERIVQNNSKLFF